MGLKRHTDKVKILVFILLCCKDTLFIVFPFYELRQTLIGLNIVQTLRLPIIMQSPKTNDRKVHI
jgi:hypothetical protein